MSAPYLAIPTTAGTGAEVTRNAVLASPEHRVKVSLRSPHMLPRVALVDPVLTHSLPPAVTASTGMDALAQLIEPFVSIKSNPLTDSFCREGMRRAAGSLQRAYEHGGDATAREEMSLASLLGGLALANAGLGAVHGFAGPIGGMFPAPHGAVCARLLPPVMAINVRALRERQGVAAI
jgi:alcohol dehydrogenase class IV